MVGPKKLTVEEQLAIYRKRKKREEEVAALKHKVRSFFTSVFTVWRRPENAATLNTPGPGGGEQAQETEGTPSQSDNSVKIRRRQGSMGDDSVVLEEELPEPPCYTRLDWVMLLLKVVMWLLLQKVFILLEFGAVFFIFSAFVFIWYNLRNEPKKKGEASAYSVFNPNCEQIDGTFTAEQFERELLYKM